MPNPRCKPGKHEKWKDSDRNNKGNISTNTSNGKKASSREYETETRSTVAFVNKTVEKSKT
jgi:hypothetical protein